MYVYIYNKFLFGDFNDNLFPNDDYGQTWNCVFSRNFPRKPYLRDQCLWHIFFGGSAMTLWLVYIPPMPLMTPPLPPNLPFSWADWLKVAWLSAQSFVALHTLWLFDIAMGNGPFIDGLPLKMAIFNSYVKWPQVPFFPWLATVPFFSDKLSS